MLGSRRSVYRVSTRQTSSRLALGSGQPLCAYAAPGTVNVRTRRRRVRDFIGSPFVAPGAMRELCRDRTAPREFGTNPRIGGTVFAMARTALVFAALSAALLVSADVKKHTFAGREWSLDVPRAYVQASTAQPDPSTSVTVFAPNARLDGTRPMIQVLLKNVPKDGGADFLTKFGEQMIDTVRRRREEWKVERSVVKVGTRTLTRFAWRGVTIPAKDGAQARFPARGVMLVGVDGGVAFMLHTQDSETFAAETLAASEPALRTFRIAAP